MEEIKDDLCLIALPDGKSFKLAEDYVAIIKFDKTTEIEYTVPKDTVSDLASTPRIIWSWIPPMGKHIFAAIVHDSLYSNSSVAGTDGVVFKLSRKQVDEVFYNKMVECGVNKVKARFMQGAVRSFGWKFWKNDSK